jgi:hypothetical protein
MLVMKRISLSHRPGFVRHDNDGTRSKDVTVEERDRLADQFEENRTHLRAVAYRTAAVPRLRRPCDGRRGVRAVGVSAGARRDLSMPPLQGPGGAAAGRCARGMKRYPAETSRFLRKASEGDG